MTKKHFSAIAERLVCERRHRNAAEGTSRFPEEAARFDGAYSMAIYICNAFGEHFDRKRFDDYIRRHSNELEGANRD